MTCRACHHEHPPMQSCGTAARLREAGLIDKMNAMPQRNQPVTTEPVACNHCVTKDTEIERLRDQLEKLGAPVNPAEPKRDRAAYMREYRAAKVAA